MYIQEVGCYMYSVAAQMANMECSRLMLGDMPVCLVICDISGICIAGCYSDAVSVGTGCANHKVHDAHE